jgi:hypothetical protein
MSSNKLQVSEHKKAGDYLCCAGEPETRHREDVMVIDITDAKAGGLTHLKLACNGHVVISQSSTLRMYANISLDCVGPTSVRRPQQSLELVPHEEKFDTWHHLISVYGRAPVLFYTCLAGTLFTHWVVYSLLHSPYFMVCERSRYSLHRPPDDRACFYLRYVLLL